MCKISIKNEQFDNLLAFIYFEKILGAPFAFVSKWTIPDYPLNVL